MVHDSRLSCFSIRDTPFLLDSYLDEPFKPLAKFLPMFQYDNPVKINSSVIPGLKIDVLKVEIHKNISCLKLLAQTLLCKSSTYKPPRLVGTGISF